MFSDQSIVLDESLEKKLRQRLHQILPRASETVVEELMDNLLQPETPPSDSLAARLLDESCTPNEIHLALIYCRNALLFMQSAALTDIRGVQKHLAYYDRMTSFLMKAIELRHERNWKSLQDELLNEGHAHLISRAVNHWSQEREITLYNYFREMPVSVPVTLLHVGENGFTIEKKNELVMLLSASEDGNSVYARLPESELSIRLTVEDVTRKTVHWQYGSFSQLTREKRRDVRVQSSTPLKIRLKSSDQNHWSGSILDISTNGLGLSFACDTPFQVGDILIFSTLLQGYGLTGKGAVCWVSGRDGHYQAGLAIEYEAESHLRLGNEVQRRQKNLLGELRMMGIPDILSPG